LLRVLVQPLRVDHAAAAAALVGMLEQDAFLPEPALAVDLNGGAHAGERRAQRVQQVLAHAAASSSSRSSWYPSGPSPPSPSRPSATRHAASYHSRTPRSRTGSHASSAGRDV